MDMLIEENRRAVLFISKLAGKNQDTAHTTKIRIHVKTAGQHGIALPTKATTRSHSQLHVAFLVSSETSLQHSRPQWAREYGGEHTETTYF